MGMNIVKGIEGRVLGGVTSGIYRQAPWHGFGEITDSKGRTVGKKQPLLTNPRETREILELAGIDWKVVDPTLDTLVPYPLLNADSHKVIVREDTQRVLGVHSDAYGVLQNELCVDFVAEILKHRSDAQLESATELYGGEILFAVVKFHDGVKVTRRNGAQLDMHTPFMGVYWSHNGQYPLGVKYMRHEWVCENTFTPWNAQTGLVVRHTRNAEQIATAALRAVEGMMTAMDDFDREVERLLRVEADKQTLTREVIPAILGDRPDDKAGRQLTNWEKAFDGIVAEWDGFTEQSTAYDVVQAVQGFEQHTRTTRGNRDVSNINRLLRDNFPLTAKAAKAFANA